MAPYLFRSLLVIVVLYTFIRGGREERVVACLCLFGSLLTSATISPLDSRYDQIETAVLLIDFTLFAGFTGVALLSQRFWPLWVAGLQLTTLVGHALKSVDASLIPKAYGAAIGLWSYPILLILTIATWRCYLYRQKGPDRTPELGG